MRKGAQLLFAAACAALAEQPASTQPPALAVAGIDVERVRRPPTTDWSIEPHARFEFDVGWVEEPDGIIDPRLGWGSLVRRARLGVDGTMPGRIDYQLDVDFSEGTFDVINANFAFQATDAFELTLGQHRLDQLTSSRFGTFVERAAFLDAFGFERRIGASARYATDAMTVSAGAYTVNIDDLWSGEGGSWVASVRVAAMPKVRDVQFHVGGSANYRNFEALADRGETRGYSQRPFTHTTEVRFIATPELAVREETAYGVEFGAIAGPFHAVGELHWLDVDRVGDPSASFFGGYAEIGVFLTGERPGYNQGQLTRTRIAHALGEGGIGAVQLNLRFDHLDLDSADVVGGKQDAYLASLVWMPNAHFRLLVDYGRLSFRNAAIPTVTGDRSYAANVFAARAHIDF